MEKKVYLFFIKTPEKSLITVSFPIKKGENLINAAVITPIEKSYPDKEKKITEAAEKQNDID